MSFTFLLPLYVGLMITIAIINYIVGKIFNVDLNGLFSENYVNNRHKKIDWIIRIIAVPVAIGIYIFSYNVTFNQSTGLIVASTLMFFSIILNQLTSIYMEKKHLANTNQYKATIVKSILINITIIVFLYVIQRRYV